VDCVHPTANSFEENKSFFASFFSKKEGLPYFFPFGTIAKCPATFTATR
jgi:hypothetical protein